MKTIKNIILLVISLIFIGCPLPDQEYSKIDFILFNQTDKNVKVLGFVQRAPDFPADPINIQPNDLYKVTRITGLDNNTVMSFYSIKNGGVDSVRVIFNNEKVKVYTRTPPDNCNICDGDENYQYFITEEDYESAEDCNGDCE